MAKAKAKANMAAALASPFASGFIFPALLVLLPSFLSRYPVLPVASLDPEKGSLCIACSCCLPVSSLFLRDYLIRIP